MNEAPEFSSKFGDNPDISSDDEEVEDGEENSNEEDSDEEDSDEEEERKPKTQQRMPSPKPQRKVQKAQRFKLVGLDSSRDFQSFAPGDEYEQNPSQKVSLFITVLIYQL